MSKTKQKEKRSQANPSAPRKTAKANALPPVPWLWLAVIAVITFVVYTPALRNGFVNLDDDRYVYQNTKWIERPAEAVADKPNGAVIKEMFSIPGGYHMGNYHPFTMVTYKMIHGVAGLDPFAYHLFNLLLHVLNTLLAFFFIRRLTRKNELAAAAALLFGVHTLHVESVAWVSELKDLMYAFFFFASLICYLIYLERQPAKRFLVFAVLLFVCSLLSKAMAASLSVVLVLIDFYKGRKFTTAVLLEKAPFFALSVIFGVIAIKAQASMDAIQDAQLFKFYERIVFACYGFMRYLGNLVLPIDLSAYYAYPLKTNGHLPGFFYLYPIALVAVATATIISLRKTKKVFFGIGFFAVTVFLVLQLLPVGGAIMADRYAYIPSLGIFFLVGEGLYDMYIQPQKRVIAVGVLTLLTVVYGALTFQRCSVWKNGMTMWSDVIDKSTNIALAYNNRGVLYNERGQKLLDSVKADASYRVKANDTFTRAISDFDNALRLNNKDTQAWSNRGLSFWRLGQLYQATGQQNLVGPNLDSAVVNLRKAVAIDPGYAIAWSNLGSVLYTSNRTGEALEAFEKAVAANPSFADGWYNIGIMKYNMNRKPEACDALRRAASLGMQHASDALRDLCK